MDYYERKQRHSIGSYKACFYSIVGIIITMIIASFCSCKPLKSTAETVIRDSVNIRDSIRIKDSTCVTNKVVIKDSVRIKDSTVVVVDSAGNVKQIKEYHSVKEHHTETDSTAYYKNLFNDAIHELVKERDSKKEVRVTVEKPLAWWQQFLMWSGVVSWALAVFAIGLYPAIRKSR